MIDQLLLAWGAVLATGMWLVMMHALIDRPIQRKRLVSGIAILLMHDLLARFLWGDNLGIFIISNFLIMYLSIKIIWKMDVIESFIYHSIGYQTCMFIEVIFMNAFFYLTGIPDDQIWYSGATMTIGSIVATFTGYMMMRHIRKCDIPRLVGIFKTHPRMAVLMTVIFLTVDIALMVLVYINSLLYRDDSLLWELSASLNSPFTLTIIAVIVFHLSRLSVYLIGYSADKRKEYKEIRIRRAIDHLTKAYTRDEGIRRVEEDLRDNGKKDRNTVVCFLDVNNLKSVNDTFGHLEGDRLITIVVETVKRHIRQEDYIIRFGGDEFVVVFSDCDPDSTKAVMERVRDELSRVRLFDGQGHQPISYDISFSIGIADAMSHPDRSAVELVDLADKYMYEEKRLVKSAT